MEDGDWQGRIVGAFSPEDIELIRSFANVEKVVVNEEAIIDEDTLSELYQISEEYQPITVLDLYFHKPSRIYQSMTLVSEKFGLEKEQVTYNYQLLSMYLIRIPGDDKPRMNFPLYVTVLIITCVSLVLVIHNSFAVSMNARIHQLGILSSIGATPQQIRAYLIQEALALCALPIIGGSLAGIGIGYGLMKMMNALAAQMTGRHDLVFRVHPIIIGLTILFSLLTVLISAWIPARKLAKLTPLEAIRGSEEPQLTRKKHSPILSLSFGIEGELAGNALKAQKKALRTSTISLTLSFFAFTLMMCFFKLSEISTDYTYFARYQDAWDVMATVRNVRIEEFEPLADIQAQMAEQGVASCVVYQKASATALLSESAVSDEVNALGGLEVVGQIQAIVGEGTAETDTESEDGMQEDGMQEETVGSAGGGEKVYPIQMPIIVLDDAGFEEYCRQIGVALRLDGAVVLNRIWDSINSNFRYKEYIPYVKEQGSTLLQCGEQGTQGIEENGETTDGAGDSAGEGTFEIPTIGYTDQAPVLREEYDNYALVHVMPLSLWREISEKIGQNINIEENIYVRILTNREKVFDLRESELLLCLNCTGETLTQLIGQKYEIETENRIQEKLTNDQLIWGYQVVIGVFCVLLAIIGLANVFSYTLGFLRQRRRECARYLSVGMTPGSLKKMFCIEMLVIAGRPVLITLPVTGIAVSFMIKASYLNPVEFWSQASYVPIAIFIVAIFGFVAIAYSIGGRKILKDSLVEALRNDALM